MKSSTKIDAKAIKDKIRSRESDRKKLSFYLSGSLYEEFKNACDDLPASQVLEELMRAFIESSPKGRQR